MMNWRDTWNNEIIYYADVIVHFRNDKRNGSYNNMFIILYFEKAEY